MGGVTPAPPQGAPRDLWRVLRHERQGDPAGEGRDPVIRPGHGLRYCRLTIPTVKLETLTGVLKIAFNELLKERSFPTKTYSHGKRTLIRFSYTYKVLLRNINVFVVVSHPCRNLTISWLLRAYHETKAFELCVYFILES